jgi:allophanate hydrolase
MDLAGLALPGPPRTDGLPHGITLLGPAFTDRRLLELGAQWADEAVTVALPGTIRLAVAGAHLSGLPLNGQLTERGARLVRATTTAAGYRLYALPGPGVARPGLIRVPDDTTSIEVEVWELTPAALGSLMTLVPAPLAIGRVTLGDGEEVQGFTCEGHAAADAIDVTAYGGWRTYLESTVVA